MLLGNVMINTIPAKKIGMTSVYDGSGTTVPVTLVQPIDCVVTEIKRPEKHGYAAVQVAYGETIAKRINKPHQGVLDKAGIKEPMRKFFEVRLQPEELDQYTPGQRLVPKDFLKNWGHVTIIGTAKGKGFAGAMKRWGFAGQMSSHGDPDNRRPQSAGATDAARVFKGKKGPGRMGNWQTTIKGATVFDFDSDLNVLALTGSVPGPNGAVVFVNLVAERALEAEE